MRAHRFLGSVVGALAISRIIAACGGDDTNGGNIADAGDTNDATTDGAIASDAATDSAVVDAGPPPCLVDASGPYLMDALEVSLGADFGCALRQDGTVACWGANQDQEVAPIADGGIAVYHADTIAFPSAAGKMKHVSVGGSFGCAVSETDNVWCWGANYFGQLAEPAVIGIDGGVHSVPEIVKESSGASLVVRDFHAGSVGACAITTDNRLLCWGRDDVNELGVDAGPAGGSAVPIPGPTLTFPVSDATFTSVGGMGGLFMCVKSTTEINCWGSNLNDSLALPSTPTGFNGAVAAALTTSGATFPMKTVTTALYASCAIDSTQKVWCWGDNSVDELGNDASTTSAVPVPVTLPEAGTALDVGVGYLATCVVAENRNAYCFGNGHVLGNGYDAGLKQPAPQLVVGVDGGAALSPVARISNGGDPICATLVSTCGPTGPGPVFCWGYGATGDLGNTITGLYSYTPVPVIAPAP